MDAFDPYHKWLGIPPNLRPPNHYRLLGLELFEADPDVIAAAADRQMAYIRQCAAGEHAEAAQEVLNELANARLSLLNVEKKRTYDHGLQAQSPHAALPAGRSPVLAVFGIALFLIVGVSLSSFRDPRASKAGTERTPSPASVDATSTQAPPAASAAPRAAELPAASTAQASGSKAPATGVAVTGLPGLKDLPSAAPTDPLINDPELNRWIREVAALPPEEQAAAVARKLQELNPGFDGVYTSKIQNGAVSTIGFFTDDVTTIAPVRAFLKLKRLECTGAKQWSGKLSDLSPLKGMPLTELVCHSTQISDLSPLKGMPLVHLNCGSSKVADLSPLTGMPLTHLYFPHTQVTDLTPLKGMALRDVRFQYTPVADITPLFGLPISTMIELHGTKIAPGMLEEFNQKRGAPRN